MATTTASSSSFLTRPIYFSRLRRAFLLRVHPDRFRTHPNDAVRSGQATLVKALASRMSQHDFTAWQQSRTIAVPHHQHQFDNTKNEATAEVHSYFMETRDGTLFQAKISLNASVESILKSMVAALKRSGVANLPEPPSLNNDNQEQQKGSKSSTAFHNSNNPRTEHQQKQQPFNSSSCGSYRVVNERYNIMSQRGRNLFHFLQQLDSDEILERKASRTDAQAAAQQVRHMFQFQAVDATSLGWSSASVAVLLQRLMALHEEHADSKLHVTSFYPIRVVFSQDDFHHALDLHGGLLRLNPSDSVNQWLDTLRLVDATKLKKMQSFSNKMLERTKVLQGELGIRFKKGHSCSNKEYYYFLERLYQRVQDKSKRAASPDNNNKIVTCQEETMSSSLTIEPITATIETSQACRRPLPTSDGTIRLGASMTEDMVREAVAGYAHIARDHKEEHKRELEQCKNAIYAAQWQLGLQKIYRTGMVSNEDFLECLGRLLLTVSPHHTTTMAGHHHDDYVHSNFQHVIKMGLGGNALGIAASGHFCHLADDGSLVIPLDWQ